MKISKPYYYDSFRCIASACPDSCCKEWDVQVDDTAAQYYRSLPGELGNRLRQVLSTEDGETVMTIVDGRCPMWRHDGLCRIQAELGEQALCTVCREFPRLRHDYGSFTELGLELSCPEAAKYILSDTSFAVLEEDCPGGEEPEYDTQAMDILQSTRQIALRILSGAGTVREKLAALLLYGYQAQDELDGAEPEDFSFSQALETAGTHAKAGTVSGFSDFFAGLEILTPQWKELLSAAAAPAFSDIHISLAGYLVRRYWLQAVSDYDLVSRVKWIVIACLLNAMLPRDPIRNAQLFSKEIENDADNIDAILDGAYTCPAFTDDKLLGMLMT